MQRNISHEQLVRKIQRLGAEAQDHRQVQRRLQQLLPDRLEIVVSELKLAGMSPGKALRSALVSEAYKNQIAELVAVTAASLETRIQYETHIMLIEARRSLRRLRR